jgi:AraC family transcriptional regulator
LDPRRGKRGQDFRGGIGDNGRMNAWPQPRLDPLDRARRHIEQNLENELCLGDLADAAGLSPFHFSREFTGRFGFSPMAYVRARRLEVAAERLRSGPSTRLIDLALDAGFDSQEGFTRAFVRTFGVAPGRYRSGERPPKPPLLAQRTAHLPLANLIQAPTPARKPALRIAGLAADYDETTIAGIPGLWRELEPHLPLQGQTGAGSFGVCAAGPTGQGLGMTLHYIAGVEIAPGVRPPPGFEVVELPARPYLVFRQVLDGGPLHPQMQAAVREIWGQRVPRSGCALARAPELEVYPEAFHPEAPGAWVEWWIPVED